MICISPYRPDSRSLEFRCGRCMPCRVHRRQEWTTRILLENGFHHESCFLTLTYADTSLPRDWSVSKKELSSFIKKLRASSPRLRFFGVGEYGDLSWRPHYHVMLFGHVPSQEQLSRVWDKGLSQIGTISTQSARYCAGYTVKKLTSSGDYRLPEHLAPEFANGSRMPGIGLGPDGQGLEDLCSWYFTRAGSKFLQTHRDICHFVRISGKVMPLDRYLKAKMRDYIGLPEKDEVRTQRAFLSQQEAMPEFEARAAASQRRARSWRLRGRTI